jgi:hypothetical protein
MSNFKKAIKEAFAAASLYNAAVGHISVHAPAASAGIFFKTLYEGLKNNNGQPAPKDNTPPKTGNSPKS